MASFRCVNVVNVVNVLRHPKSLLSAPSGACIHVHVKGTPTLPPPPLSKAAIDTTLAPRPRLPPIPVHAVRHAVARNRTNTSAVHSSRGVPKAVDRPPGLRPCHPGARPGRVVRLRPRQEGGPRGHGSPVADPGTDDTCRGLNNSARLKRQALSALYFVCVAETNRSLCSRRLEKYPSSCLMRICSTSHRHVRSVVLFFSQTLILGYPSTRLVMRLLS